MEAFFKWTFGVAECVMLHEKQFEKMQRLVSYALEDARVFPTLHESYLVGVSKKDKKDCKGKVKLEIKYGRNYFKTSIVRSSLAFMSYFIWQQRKNAVSIYSLHFLSLIFWGSLKASGCV